MPSDSMMSDDAEQITFEQLMSSAGDSLVRTYPWPESEQDWRELEAAYFGILPESWENCGRVGLLLRTCRVFSLRKMGMIFSEFCESWMNSGMAWAGACLTQDTSEFPSTAAECSLSEVLESLYPYECYLSTKMPQWFIGEFERRGLGHHISAHFLSGQRASSTAIFRFLSQNARIHMRVLTVRECERVMGFPDDWTLIDTEASATQ